MNIEQFTLFNSNKENFPASNLPDAHYTRTVSYQGLQFKTYFWFYDTPKFRFKYTGDGPMPYGERYENKFVILGLDIDGTTGCVIIPNVDNITVDMLSSVSDGETFLEYVLLYGFSAIDKNYGLFFVESGEINDNLYNWLNTQLVKSQPITYQITKGMTYKFNDVLHEMVRPSFMQYTDFWCEFSSNNQYFNELQPLTDNSVTISYYGNDYRAVPYNNGSWENEEYKTITFIEDYFTYNGSNEWDKDFCRAWEWLDANGTFSSVSTLYTIPKGTRFQFNDTIDVKTFYDNAPYFAPFLDDVINGIDILFAFTFPNDTGTDYDPTFRAFGALKQNNVYSFGVQQIGQTLPNILYQDGWVSLSNKDIEVFITEDFTTDNQALYQWFLDNTDYSEEETVTYTIPKGTTIQFNETIDVKTFYDNTPYAATEYETAVNGIKTPIRFVSTNNLDVVLKYLGAIELSGYYIFCCAYISDRDGTGVRPLYLDEEGWYTQNDEDFYTFTEDFTTDNQALYQWFIDNTDYKGENVPQPTLKALKLYKHNSIVVGNMKATKLSTEPYVAPQVNVIGFTGLTNPSGELTWTDDIANFGSFTKTTNGDYVNITSPLDNVFPFNQIHEVADEYDNVFISYPKMWIKWVLAEDGTIDGFKVSATQQDEDYFIPDAFLSPNGEGYLDEMWLGKYNASGTISTEMYSKSGKTYTRSETRANARSAARSYGTKDNLYNGYQMYDFAQYTLYNFLCMLYCKTSDVKTVFKGLQQLYTNTGNGYVYFVTGACDAINTLSGEDTVTGCVKMLGIENPWGRMWCFVDGIVFSGSSIYAHRLPINFSDSISNGVALGFSKPTSSGFVKSLKCGNKDETKSYAFINSIISSNDAYFKNRYNYSSSEDVIMYYSNTYNSDVSSPNYSAGLYNVYTSTSTSSIVGCGRRLTRRPIELLSK